MKKLITLLLMVIVASCACLFVGCDMMSPSTNNPPATDTFVGELWVGDIYVSVGKTATIEYEFVDDATEEDVSYSFNGDGLTFIGDEVTAVTVGEYTVTASSDHYEAEFTVHVVPSLFTIENLDIEKGYYHFIDIDFEVPANAEDLTYTYDTQNLTIEGNKVTAKGSLGAFQVIATGDYYETEFTIYVKQGTNTSSYKASLDDRLKAITSSTDQSTLTLLAGDSFMDPAFIETKSNGYWSKNFANANVVTLGVGGSKAEQWYWYAQTLTVQPQNLVLHIGTNDIFDWGFSDEQTTYCVIRLLDLFHEKMPNTNIYWFSIEPRVGRTHNVGNAKAVKVNTQILSYANQNSSWLTYVDSATPFTEDVGDTEEWKDTVYYADNIHPSYAGYELMFNLAKQAGLEITEFEISFAINNVDLVYPGTSATIVYSEGNSEDVTYSCNNSGITVEGGVVNVASSVAPGTYTVTAKKGNLTKTFTVTVCEIPYAIDNINLVYPGYFAYLNYSKGDADGVTYSCTNSGITVDGDKVKVASNVSQGTYTVTAKKDNLTKTFTVTVGDVQFVNAQPGKTGTGFIDRLNSTLSSINGYDEGELVIFAGDSFMDERWFFKDFYTRFAGKNAHLDGISSSRAEQWIWYGQRLIEYSPKALVLHIGTNDIFDGGKNATATVSILKEMFELYHKYMPETKIYWWSIEPRVNPTSAHTTGNPIAEVVNEQIKTYMQGKDWLVYLDSATPFKADAYNGSTLKSSYTETTLYGDNVHPKCPEGYDVLMNLAYNAGLTITTKTSSVETYADVTTVDGTDKMGTAKPITLGRDILFTTSVKINSYSGNGHFTLHFNEHTASTPRFLIWNMNSNGKFMFTASDYSATSDVFDATGSDKSFELAVLIKGKNAYMFVDGVLRVAYLNIPVQNFTTFYYGTESMSATFSSTKVIGIEHATATTYLNKVSAYENSDNTKSLIIKDIALTKTVMSNFTTLQNATDTQAKDSFGTATTVAHGTNYLFSTTIKFNSFNKDYGNGAHITLNFVNHTANDLTNGLSKGDNTRFLIWDVKSDDTFYYVPWTPDHCSWGNRKNVTDGVAVTAGTTTITVRILVVGDNAYMFVDGELKCAWLNTIVNSRLEVGTEAMGATFSNNTIYKSGNSTYTEYLNKVSTYEAETGTASKTYIDLGV